jgi:hypothetical protein
MDTGLSEALSLLSQPPLVINRLEVMKDGVILTPITGLTVTPSGYLGLFIVLVQQLFAYVPARPLPPPVLCDGVLFVTQALGFHKIYQAPARRRAGVARCRQVARA